MTSEPNEPAAPADLRPVARVVVAGALVRDSRLLAGRRTEPAWLAGGWELPGGKVEVGESDRVALTRELLEELGVQVSVGEQLGGTTQLTEGYVLRVYAVRLLAGTPEPLEDHDELRWLTAGELDSVRWLPGDLPYLPHLAALLDRQHPLPAAAPPAARQERSAPSRTME